MSIQCKDGDLAMVTRDEPGLEANIGRLLWVYGPVAEDLEIGPVWETVPATSEPMAYLCKDGQVSFDRHDTTVFHPDAWMTPVQMDSFAGNRPPKPVTAVPLTKEWLEAVANSGMEYVHLKLPARNDSETRLTGQALRQRLRQEVCIPVEEDYGYAEWFWFPGRSLSATAHWWVKEATTQIIGQVYGPADDEAYDLYHKLQKDNRVASVFADGDWNTVMYLPARFEANLIPRYARATFDITEGRYVKCGRRRKNGRRYRKSIDDDQLLANWRTSEAVAEASEPDSFLENLRLELRRPTSHPLPTF